MPRQKPSKIIIDTNIWISFLIGKELQDKLKKYFNQDKVSDLISLIDILADRVKIKKIDKICRDPKDDFILSLSKESRANYLITGDKDLLDIKVYGRTKIVTVKQFKEKIR